MIISSFFGPFSLDSRGGCVGKSQQISCLWISQTIIWHQQLCHIQSHLNYLSAPEKAWFNSNLSFWPCLYVYMHLVYAVWLADCHYYTVLTGVSVTGVSDFEHTTINWPVGQFIHWFLKQQTDQERNCAVLGWWWAACPACPRGALYKSWLDTAAQTSWFLWTLPTLSQVLQQRLVAHVTVEMHNSHK